MKFPEMKTTFLENLIEIRGNAEKRQTEIIDVNIKTNVTVQSNSNTKGSKFIQKSIFVLVLFFTGTFTVVLFNVKKELQVLKSQERCIETKIAILMKKYDKLNNHLSRVRSHMNYNRYHQPLTTLQKLETLFSQSDKVVEKYESSNEAEFMGRNKEKNYKNDSILIGNSSSSNSTRENEPNSEKFRDNARGDTTDENYSKSNSTRDNDKKNSNRFTRMILNVTTDNDNVENKALERNFTDNRFRLNNGEKERIQMINDNDNDGNIDLWSEPRTGRMRRDDGRRGKIRTKKKRRPNRSRRRLGPLVATFIGGIPEQHVTDTGSIGPWIKLSKNVSHYDLQRFHLADSKTAIEITMNGLYMISTQIFYIGQHTTYSYWVLINSEGSSATQRVTKCSAVSGVSANEVSCGTNVVLFLRRGDRLRIQQQESDRLINLREGHSYVQLVLLSNESERKQRTV